jgi:hypothetical protein
MTQKAAETLHRLGYEEGEIRPDYSGRGMFGKTTHGVVYDSMADFYTALAYVTAEGNEEEREAVAGALENLNTDNMGFGVIVY